MSSFRVIICLCEPDLSTHFVPDKRVHRIRDGKKKDVAEYPEALNHVGLLVNEPFG